MTRVMLVGGFLIVAFVPVASSSAPPITAIAVAPDGNSIVTGSQAGVQVLSFPTLELQRSLPTKLLHVHDLRFSPDGKMLAAPGGTPAGSGEIEFFTWPDGNLSHRWRPQGDLIFGFAWSGDGERWATASLDQTVYVQGAEAGRLKGHSRGVCSVAFLGDGRLLVSAGLDNSLRLWELESGRLVRTLDNHTAPVVDLAVRPANEGLPMIASAGEDKTVRLWQPTIGRLVRFAQLPSEPLAIAWTPDGNRLCASCRDGRVRLIDPETVEVTAEIAAIDGWAYSLAVTPNGKRLVVAGEQGQIKVLPLTVDP